MPTSRLWERTEVRFPADFTRLYQNGFSYYPSGMSGGGSGSLAGVSWNPNDALAPGGHPKGWQEEAIAKVRAEVQSRQRSRINNITGGASGRRAFQELEGGCDDCRGGSFHNEGAFVLAGKGKRIHGGVMRTLAGRQHVAKRLTQRVAEFNKRDAEQFDTPGFSEGGEPSAPPTEDGEVVIQLGEHLAALSDAMTSGVWDKDTTKEARGILSTLQKVGHLIPQNQITMVLRQVDGVISEIVRTAGAPYPGNAANTPLAQKEKGILRLVATILERAKTLLEDLSANSALAPGERKMRTGALRNTLQRQAEAQRLGRVRGVNAGYRAPALPPGRLPGLYAGAPPAGYRQVPGLRNAPALPPGYDLEALDLFL
jgi:hypothetical protein